MRSAQTSHSEDLTTKISKKLVVLHLPTCTALGTGPPECTVEHEQKKRLDPTVDVIFVYRKAVEDCQRQTERSLKVEHADAMRMEHEGREEAKTGPTSTHPATSSLECCSRLILSGMVIWSPKRRKKLY